MKNLFNRTLSVLCAVMLLISAVSAWAAAEEPSTPTDLNPAGEPKSESGEEGIDSVEIIINKTLTIGQNWEGKMKKTKPAVLKLDVTNPGLVYMLVEGKDVWATVEKSDRLTENPARTQTNPETDRLLLSWEAEEGSYLITLGPVEPNLLAMAAVSFMDKTAYEAWEAAQAEKELEAEPDKETEDPKEGLEEKPETEPGEAEVKPGEEPEKEPELEEEPETEPEQIVSNEDEGILDTEAEPEESIEDENVTDAEELMLPKDRKVSTSITWDDENPDFGSVAHINATLTGYEDVEYSLQWQWSEDRIIWNDIEGATNETMDVVYTPQNGDYHWRILLYIIEPDEE